MDPKTTTLTLRRTVPATPKQIFAAWTTREHMERWTHPDTTAGVEVEVDLRVGGHYSMRLEVEGGHVTACGTYREVDPPRQLVYTSWGWKETHPMKAETLVTVEIVPTEEGTEIRLSQEGFPRAQRPGRARGGVEDLSGTARRPGGRAMKGACAATLLSRTMALIRATATTMFLCTASPALATPQATPKVLLIGIDGVRPDILAEVPTPNIDALAASGWYTADARTTTPSVSGPSWSSMLTGVWPEKHGVTDNNFSGRDYDTWPGFLTRAKQERPELATFAAVDWLPLAELERGGPVLPASLDTRVVLDGYDLGWAEADGELTARAVMHLGAADPDAMFVYLGNPDETSHEHGSIGTEYRDAIALADRHVGMLVDAVQARPGYEDEDWLVLISTDHGRREDGGHGGESPEEMTIFILASGPATGNWPPPGPAFIVDVAATALDHLGIEIDPGWGLDGRSLGAPR